MRRLISSLVDLVSGTPTQASRPTYVGGDFIFLEDAQLNIRGFGGVGDGSHDDTDAITEAWNDFLDNSAFAAAPAAAYFVGGGRSPIVPDGHWTYDGPGLNFGSQNRTLLFAGSGPENCRIELGDCYLFDVPTTINRGMISGLQIQGGKGLFRHSLTTTNNLGRMVFDNLELLGYTECGIGTMSENFPYILLSRIMFRGDPDTAIGYAHAGDMAGGVVSQCMFDSDKVHMKLGLSGVALKVMMNSFLRNDRPASGGVTDIWFVPAATSAKAGQDTAVLANKFGNELLDAADYRILYADEDAASGADFLSRPAHSTLASTGYVIGHKIKDNTFSWAASTSAVPMIYSTTDRVFNNDYSNNHCPGAEFSSMLSLLDGDSAVADRVANTNILGPQYNLTVGHETLPTAHPVSKPHYGTYPDPFNAFQGFEQSLRPYTAGQDPTYQAILTTALSAWSLTSTTRTTGQADVTGGLSASEFAFSTGGLIYTTLAALAVNRPVFIELDVKQGAATAIVGIELRLQDPTSGPIRLVKRINIQADWYRLVYLWMPTNTSTDVLSIRPSPATFGGGGTVKLLLANMIAYHAKERVNTGPIKLGATTGVAFYVGTGSPENVQTAEVGSLYVDVAGVAGNVLYHKPAGTGNDATGWVALA